jgi:hypothetical protein
VEDEPTALRGRYSYFMTKRFDELSDFISQKMRMSHIYQPAMLMELLRRGGKAAST